MLARGTIAQSTPGGGEDASRRYDRQVVFDVTPVEVMAPTQTESKAESLFAPLDFDRSDSRGFDGSIAPTLPRSMYPIMPPGKKNGRKKNWLLPGADKSKDEKDSPETGWGWLADRVGQIRQERSATLEEDNEGEPPVTLDQLTRDGQKEKSDRQFGFQTQLFEPVLSSDIGANQVANDSPDNLLAGRMEEASDSQTTYPDSMTQSRTLERPDDSAKDETAATGNEQTWTVHRTEPREQEETTMFSQTRELLAPLTQQRFTPSLQQPILSLDPSGDNKSSSGILFPRPSSDHAAFSPSGFQSPSASGLGTGLRPVLSEPTHLPGLVGFQNGPEPTRSFSSGATQPLRPTEPFKPIQDNNWSGLGQ